MPSIRSNDVGVRPGDVGVDPGDESIPGTGAKTDEVWYVMDSLPYGGDVDPTLPMYVGIDMPASVGTLLKNENLGLATIGNEVALDEPSSLDLPMKVPANTVPEDMVPDELGSPKEVPLSSHRLGLDFLIVFLFATWKFQVLWDHALWDVHTVWMSCRMT